jgi:hypothetical protein
MLIGRTGQMRALYLAIRAARSVDSRVTGASEQMSDE